MFPNCKRSFEFNFGKKAGLLAIVPFLILLVWFGLKLLQIQSPHQSFADAHIALQLSKGWLEGRPLLYDTYYGDHDKIHNYFFILLLGPVTWLTGIYGLFATYIILTGLLFYRIGQAIAGWRDRRTIWVTLLLFGLGPLAYFVFIDVFGWHPEQYYFPLMGFSALFLAKKRWIPAGIFLFLTATVKESAPILLCGLLLFVSITATLLHKPQSTLQQLLFAKRNILLVAASALIFLAGMALLSYKSTGPSRLMTALQVLTQVQAVELISYLLKFLLALVLFYAILILPFIPLLKKRQGGRWLFVFLAFYLSVLGVAFFIEGLLYFPDFDAGLPYPTRAGSILAFFFSCYLYLAVRTAPFREPVSLSYPLWSAVFQLTFSALLVFHSWPLIETRKDLGKVLYRMLSINGSDNPIDADRRLLKKIASKLPRGAEVVAPEQYLSIFQKSYGARPERQQWLLGPPAVYVCDHPPTQLTTAACEVPESNYILLKGNHIHIWINKLWESRLANLPD